MVSRFRSALLAGRFTLHDHRHPELLWYAIYLRIFDAMRGARGTQKKNAPVSCENRGSVGGYHG